MPKYPGAPYALTEMKGSWGKEIPESKKFKSKLEDWLTNNVVEPAVNAGYPNLGAGIATVPATLAEFLLPENTAEFAPGMAGVGKLRRKGEKVAKDILEKYANDPSFKEKAKQLYYKVSNEVSEMANRSPQAPYEEWRKVREVQDYLRELLANDKGIKEVTTATNPLVSKHLSNQISDLKKFGIEDVSERTLKNIEKNNRILGEKGRAAIGAGKRLGLVDETYLRPKGYAKTPKTIKPELSQSPLQTREQYDEMLRGKNPGQEYFSGMTDEFNNAQMKEDDFDLIKQLIDKSWKAK